MQKVITFQETEFYKFVQENKTKIAEMMVSAHNNGQYACISPGRKITKHTVNWDTRPHSIGFGTRSTKKYALKWIEEYLNMEDWRDAIHFEENL